MTKKEIILGTLIMPLMVAFVLSGMALTECVTATSLIVCVVSFVAALTLAIILRREIDE